MDIIQNTPLYRKYLEKVRGDSGKKVAYGTIRLLSKKSNQTTTEMNMKLEGKNDIHPFERRLDVADTFFGSHMRYGILPVQLDGTKEIYGIHEPQFFENPAYFKEHSDRYKAHFIGNMEVNLNDKIIYKALPLENFRAVPEFEDVTYEVLESVAGNSSLVTKTKKVARNANQIGYFPFGHLQEFRGKDNNLFKISHLNISGAINEAPILTDMFSVDSTPNVVFYNIIEITGILVQGTI